MPKFYDSITDDLADWALKQPVFFIASAPLAGKHVNISPKGLPSSTFAVLSPHRVAYTDATGSGAETIAHLYENRRATLMFCSFAAAPRILRLFCTGRVVERDAPEFAALLAATRLPRIDGARALIVLDVFSVQTSCGYGVPRLAAAAVAESAFEDRETLGHFAARKAEQNELVAYRARCNARSLDGVPGLRSARRDAGERLWLGDVRAAAARVGAQRETLFVGIFLGVVMALVARLGLGVLPM